LIDNLLYPGVEDDLKSGGSHVETLSAATFALETVGMGHLCGPYLKGSSPTPCCEHRDWSSTLSPGEKQLVAAARVLLARPTLVCA
jgi:ABC-type uncharacterized transport system fused permease/ATPase subunit